MDEFNLCWAKLETLIFYIEDSQTIWDCGLPSGSLLRKPLKSVTYIIETLKKHLKGLELSQGEGSQIRALIAARFVHSDAAA